MKTAWLFPGQASQKVGMGIDLFENTKIGKSYFDKANEILGYDIKSMIFDGPEEKLKQTQFTQPSIYIVSVILGELMKNNGFQPSVVAGHSLGEYSALAVSNAFNYETGLSLVKVRAENMAKAGLKQKGSMAAIVGLDDKIIEKICNDYNGEGVVVVANYNSPGQVVISGSPAAVQNIMDAAKVTGARMAIELNVSGAFHSPLMSPARQALAEMLNSLEISDASYPIYSNIDAKPVIKGIDIKESLIRQLENPVLWTRSIFSMKESGIESFLEIGPGKVLQGLNKRIDSTIPIQGIETLDQLNNYHV